MFDANSYVRAMEPPAIKVGDHTYTGRLISFDQMLPFQKRFEDWQTDGRADITELIAFTRSLCEQIDIPADVVTALPGAAMIAAVTDFLASIMSGPASLPGAAPLAPLTSGNN